ncbi:hypothetical protein CFter6_4562 [Collimonas fungivorans]|uniref:Uncharacterized protein n=1 Tax=Collimonas fungivorans TaxID=158899 RepID=A0A127PH74_9BURK|nr:hypothetical protein [Collimonas fungivorans]AMO97152.1 hypothetical protein CFter6_4562 [Collimonas fungivorans]
MKIVFALFFLAVPMTPLFAAAPAAGLWEDVLVVDDHTLQLISHRHFIFTDRKLAAPTVFTALKDFGGEIDAFCCLEVQDTNPLSVTEIEKKFSSDHDFVQRFSQIRGLPYMYEAKLAKREIWNDKMLLLKGRRKDADDIPFSAPVIAGRLGFSEIAGNRFTTADGHQVELKTRFPDKNRQRPLLHRFTVDGKRTTFSVPVLGN